MKKLLLFCFVICLLLTGCDSSGLPRKDTYNDITYQVPSAWKKDVHDVSFNYTLYPGLFMVASKVMGNSNISFGDDFIKSNLDDAADGMYSGLPGTNLSHSEYLRVSSNLLAKKFSCCTSLYNQIYNVTALIFIYDNILYSFMIAEPSNVTQKYTGTFEEIIKSIEIIKN